MMRPVDKRPQGLDEAEPLVGVLLLHACNPCHTWRSWKKSRIGGRGKTVQPTPTVCRGDCTRPCAEVQRGNTVHRPEEPAQLLAGPLVAEIEPAWFRFRPAARPRRSNASPCGGA